MSAVDRSSLRLPAGLSARPSSNPQETHAHGVLGRACASRCTGGHLTSTHLLDKTTNDLLGRTIDVALANAMLPIRVAMNAKAADGRSAPSLRGVTTAAGEKYNLLPGGKPDLAAPKLEFKKSDSGLTIQGQARSLSEPQHLLKRRRKQLDLSEEVIVAGIQTKEEHMTQCTFLSRSTLRCGAAS